MLENLDEVLSNSSVYQLHDEWPDQNRFRFQSGYLPMVVVTVSESVAKALNIMRLQPP